MIPLLRDRPQLRVVFEHITTNDAVQFVTSAPDHIAATITVHHLLYNRNAMFSGGLRPHYFCLPVLKREAHREALGKAAISGNPKFFLGTDSAPHAHTYQGNGLRLRRYLHRARRNRVVCRGVRTTERAGQAGRLRQFFWRGLLPPAAQHRQDYAAPRKAGGCPIFWPLANTSWCRCAPEKK